MEDFTTKEKAKEILLSSKKVLISFGDWGRGKLGQFPYYNLYVLMDNYEIMEVDCEYFISLKNFWRRI